jgi:hypothetical protein
MIRYWYTSLQIQTANLMPKGLFLQNPIYMTDYCLFYSGSPRPLLGDKTQRRGCLTGGVASGMLEKVEPMEWYANCTHYVMLSGDYRGAPTRLQGSKWSPL